MKKLTTIAILISSLVSLTACNPTKQALLEENGTDSYLTYKTITLRDGRIIECIEYNGYQKYGISCNWNNPVNQNNTK